MPRARHPDPDLRRVDPSPFSISGRLVIYRLAGPVLAGLTSPWYRRNHLEIKASEGWHINRLTKPTVPDGRYGLGGVIVLNLTGSH